MTVCAQRPSAGPSIRAARWGTTALLLLGLSAWSGSGHAQPQGPRAPSAPPAASQPATATAFAKTVSTIGQALAAQRTEAFVAPAPLRSDTPAPKALELVARLSSLLTGALGPQAKCARGPMTLDQARAAAGSARVLVYLETEVAAGELRLTVDAYPIPHNIWDRLQNPRPAPVAHGFASARLDAEVRSYLASVPLVASQPLRVPLPSPEPLAVACDDFDNDGALELLIASRRALTMGRIRQQRLQVLRQAPWQTLSSVAPSPWRQPLATIGQPQPGQIDIGSSDRARALRLDGLLEVKANLSGMPVALPDGDGCVELHPGVLSPKIGPCTDKDPAPMLREFAFAFDASAAARLITPAGAVRDVWAARNPFHASLTLYDSAQRTVTVPHVGAQIALSDLDLDGEPELLTSRDVLNATDDGLLVRTWKASGALETRQSLAVPAGIAAVGVCPPDGPGARAVALVTQSELWIVR